MNELTQIIQRAHDAIKEAVKDRHPRPEEFELEISLNPQGSPLEHGGLPTHKASILIPITWEQADGPSPKKK